MAGCPLLAASTASIARARMALASRRWVAIESPWVGRDGKIGLADGLVPIVGRVRCVNLGWGFEAACGRPPFCYAL